MPEFWSGVAQSPAREAACACLRRASSGEPDAGNLHGPVRRGKGHLRFPFYSTGSDGFAAGMLDNNILFWLYTTSEALRQLFHCLTTDVV